VQNGEIATTELTGLALNTAFEAASRNIPFLPMASLGLSEVPDRQPGWYAGIEDLFGGGSVLAIKALTPDVALLHVRSGEPERGLPVRRSGCLDEVWLGRCVWSGNHSDSNP